MSENEEGGKKDWKSLLLTEGIFHKALIDRLSHICGTSIICSSDASKKYVLYVMTVNLRSVENPSYIVAWKIACMLKIPLLILVLLDGSNARRLCFALEAVTEACLGFDSDEEVALVYIPRKNIKDYWTVACRASCVIFDEPFVHPYLSYVQGMERACHQNNQIPTVRVDGSTLAPPSTLKNKPPPKKAWKWNQQTTTLRKEQLSAIHFHKILLKTSVTSKQEPTFKNDEEERGNVIPASILNHLPLSWKQQLKSSKTTSVTTITLKRKLLFLWTSSQLREISNNNDPNHDWYHWISQQQNGVEVEDQVVDMSVPPSKQTRGTHTEGMNRWRSWLQLHSKLYAKNRNDIRIPNSVSRMSGYLNLGIVSIFTLMNDLSSSSGSKYHDKFLEEIVKWREYAYCHAYHHPTNYNQSTCLPVFAIEYYSKAISEVSFTWDINALIEGQTGESTWDAMQQYLISTGELHNNARMTWGKTVVHWGRSNKIHISTLISTLCLLNDTYALDGCSPPSYTGLLWCLGLGADLKQLSRNKLSSRYRYTSLDFHSAQQTLLNRNSLPNIANSTTQSLLHANSTVSAMWNCEQNDLESRENNDGGNQLKKSKMLSMSPPDLPQNKKMKTIDYYFLRPTG